MTILTHASSSSNTSYDVFLSFRGIDTRLSFVDHLHNALLDANLKTFLDDDEINPGEDLRPELERAIKASRASIIVLSTNYASSTWCLDELVLILGQRLISNQVVIPIFYHVDPTNVRKQEGSFGVAMAEHKRRMEVEFNLEKRSLLAKKICRWNKALTEVSQLKGMSARGRKETEFIREIVTNVHSRLGGHLQSILPLLFGMEDSIESITSWLKDGSSHNADILTIVGMGGIGKTSLARHVYGLYFRLFAKSSFIECIGDKCAAQVSGLLDLQKQLFSDISQTSQIQVHDILAYTSMIENGLTRKKVFIVLDNIDSLDQMHALLGNKGLYPGSKIIVTTKDTSLTERYAPVNLLVKPKHTKLLLEGLHKKASLQLLSHHAFMSNRPKDGYEEVSNRLMKYCKGHPLALKVLGESLCNKAVAEWEDCMMGLKEETDSRIMNALKMSFDSIPSNNDKELFKHIACFFIQKDRDFAETILNSCGIRTTRGIRNLIDRCLLTVGPDNILMMHQLIQEMGRDVVRQESRHKPEERSLLWCHEDSFNVLEEYKGTRHIKGLFLDMKMLEIDMLCGSVELETSALGKMHNLMLLQLNFVQLSGSYKNFPTKLRWMCMHGFPLKYIPFELPMENLVALDMSYSNIESFDISYSNPQPPAKRQKVTGSCSKDKRLLGSLKFLTLSFSEQLRRIGGFFKLPALQRLIVIKCTRLVDICESIDQSVELVYIDLSCCKNLKKLPKTIGRLKKVKTLLLDGCDLPELPLKKRDMDDMMFGANVISINSQNSSCAIIPNDSKFFSISLPSSLARLSLANNKLSDESFPTDFSCLSMLKDLCLDGTLIVSLPNCVRTLPRLETLGMSNCLKLMSVEHPPRTLRQLNLYNNCRKPGYKNLLRKIAFDPEMASLELIADRNLLAPSSFEIEGMIKIQPMTGVDKKLLRYLGWEGLKLKEDRCLVTNYNYGGAEESQIQMYYEFGIFSTIYESRGIPVWRYWDIVSYDYEPSISFTITSKIVGLDLSYEVKSSQLPTIKIRNITQELTWIYKHCIESFFIGGERAVFLSHWMFGMNEMQVGDKITINLEKDSRHSIYWTGIGFVYEGTSMEVGDKITTNQENVEKEDPLGYYKSWNHIIGGDLSAFHLTSGEYFLSSTDFFRSLFSSSFFNANYKERTVLFNAFSPRRKSDKLGHAQEKGQFRVMRSHRPLPSMSSQRGGRLGALGHPQELDEQMMRMMLFYRCRRDRDEA